MARHFVVIAPNLTVFERLKEDFKREGGRIFERPADSPGMARRLEYVGVLQDEASGAATGGTIYLTNIHRLYDTPSGKNKKDGETTTGWGRRSPKARALDTGAALRDRITAHPRLMVLNDEAHHVWDPDSAWNEAIEYLHETIQERTGGGLVAQLDFTATPKDNKGNISSTSSATRPWARPWTRASSRPRSSARRTPVGRTADDNAAYRYEKHLPRLQALEGQPGEWEKSGKKTLLFVMCEDTEAADQIATRFNTDAPLRS